MPIEDMRLQLVDLVGQLSLLAWESKKHQPDKRPQPPSIAGWPGLEAALAALHDSDLDDSDLLSKPNSFIQGLLEKGLYQWYEDRYRKADPNRPKDGSEVSNALCGCGCGGSAARSEHNCGCCSHRMMAYCVEGEEGYGSKGLCFRCWKNYSHAADGMLYNMILQPRHISLHY